MATTTRRRRERPVGELLAAAARGDLDAFRLAARRLEPIVRASAAALAPTADALRRSVESALESAHARLAERPQEFDPAAWVAAIAREAAMVERRAWIARERARRSYRADLELALEPTLARRALGAPAAAAALGEALATLEASDRAAIEAHDGAGEPIARVAAAAQRSEAWARAAVLRARRLLAQRLREGGDGP